MRLPNASPWAVIAAAILAETAAFACNPLDANCNPPPSDPCAGPYGGTPDYDLCRKAIPSCSGLSGPPLHTCLATNVEKAKNPPPKSTGSSTSTSTYADIPNPSLYDPEVQTNAQNYDLVRDPVTGLIRSVLREARSVEVVSRDPVTGLLSTATIVENQILTQKEAFQSHSQMLMACTITNLAGRNDGLCATNPNQPECTGMAAALVNATTCVQSSAKVNPVTGKPTTCLQLGAYGYSIDEWLAFGQQYFDGMTGCFAVGDAGDVTGLKLDPDMVAGRGVRMGIDVDMAAAISAQQKHGKDGTNTSTITGKVHTPTALPANPASRWKQVSDKADDGAAALGLERGDLVKAAAEGQSFRSVFSSSPFAESLEKSTRERIETALGDPKETLDRAKEKQAAMLAEKSDESSGPPGAGARAVLSAGAGGTGGPASPESPREPASIGGKNGFAGSSGVGDRAKGGKAEEKRDRDRELSDARALFGLPSRAAKPLPGLATQGAPELGSADATLFERVKLTYRRRAPSLKAFDESKTARDVRNTEQPAFFRNL